MYSMCSILVNITAYLVDWLCSSSFVDQTFFHKQTSIYGLGVVGGDSCSRGHEIESQHQIIDVFTFICCKNAPMFEYTKNK